MRFERFIFRGNLSFLLIKVKITSSATVFTSGYNKLKIFGTQKFEFGTRNCSSNRAVSVHGLGSTRSSLPFLEPSVSQVKVFFSLFRTGSEESPTPERFRFMADNGCGRYSVFLPPNILLATQLLFLTY